MEKNTYGERERERAPIQLVAVKISLACTIVVIEKKKTQCYALGLNAAPCCTYLVTAYTHVTKQFQHLMRHMEKPAIPSVVTLASC